ncbi:MAG TPA: hypothetical protein O0X39_04170 [Methanocorpusculum sp.]|nr:hypothetical protein [Methanocorpusculum sp.]
MTENSLKDEKGNIIITSEQFNVSLKFIKAGENTDPDTGKHFKWGDSVKIIAGDKVIKLTALQAAVIRDALAVPEVAEELRARIETEKAAFMKSLGAF